MKGEFKMSILQFNFDSSITLVKISTLRKCVVAVLGGSKIAWIHLEQKLRLHSTFDTGVQIVDAVFHYTREELVISYREIDKETDLLTDNLAFMTVSLFSQEVTDKILCKDLFPPFSAISPFPSHSDYFYLGAEEGVFLLDLRDRAIQVVANSGGVGYSNRHAIAVDERREKLIVAWSSQTGTTIKSYSIKEPNAIAEDMKIDFCPSHEFVGLFINRDATLIGVVFWYTSYKYRSEFQGTTEAIGSIHVYDCSSYLRVNYIEIAGSIDKDFELQRLAEGDGRRRGRGTVKSANEIYVPRAMSTDPVVSNDDILVGMPGGDLIKVNLVTSKSIKLLCGKSSITGVDCVDEEQITCSGFEDGNLLVIGHGVDD